MIENGQRALATLNALDCRLRANNLTTTASLPFGIVEQRGQATSLLKGSELRSYWGVVGVSRITTASAFVIVVFDSCFVTAHYAQHLIRFLELQLS